MDLKLELNLNVLGIQEDDASWCAIALEMSLMGYGEIHNPIPYHGNKTEIPARMLRNIIHVFQLPPDIFD